MRSFAVIFQNHTAERRIRQVGRKLEVKESLISAPVRHRDEPDVCGQTS